MRSNKNLISLLILLILLVPACGSSAPEPLPTLIPAVDMPTSPPPTATSLPPTADLHAPTQPPPPTAVPPTHPPASTPTPISPIVGIASPKDDADIVLGKEVTVRGLTQRELGQTIEVALVSLNGRILIESPTSGGPQSWEAAVVVPPFVSGAAYFQARLMDESGNVLAEDRVPVNLVTDTTSPDRFLVLARPLAGETAVSGYNLIFDGIVYRPANSAITISVWVNDCQERIARQGFTLGRSTVPFHWQGFVVIPDQTAGPACAVAHFGEPDSADWREAVIPINILPPDDPAAKGIRIGGPTPDSHVTAGRELLLYGTALNVREGPVSVSILMENGRIISQETAPADYWGYWEFRVAIPPDVFGPAQVTVSSGDEGGDNYAESQFLINIDPAPTPES